MVLNAVNNKSSSVGAVASVLNVLTVGPLTNKDVVMKATFSSAH